MSNISSITTYDPSLGRTSELPKKELDSDTFLQLLVAQLRYQDPMSGMDQQQFMQQLSTMSSMQQQQAINTQLSSLVTQNQVTQATGLIGHTVKAYVDDTEVSGTVSSVAITSDGIKLAVGDKEIAFGDVYEVT